MTIERATQGDLETILAWLAAEAAAGDETFHGNRNLIAEGQEDGELFAAVIPRPATALHR